MNAAPHGPPVRVPVAVRNGILAVRDSSLTNMFDINKVCELARTLGFHEAAIWIRSNIAEYRNGIWNGWVADENAQA